jgi:hypothetical protein
MKEKKESDVALDPRSGITSTRSGQPAHTMEEAATNLQMRIENAVVR